MVERSKKHLDQHLATIMKDRSRDENKTQIKWLDAWFLRPLHWIFFACWAPVLSLIKLFKDHKEKYKDHQA